jgi:MscS family membrane protein
MQIFFNDPVAWLQANFLQWSDYFILIWNSGISGIDIKSLIVALGVLVLTILLRGPLAWLVISWMKKLVTKFPNGWFDEAMVAALRNPIRLLPLWIGLLIALEFLALPVRYQILFDRLLLTFGCVLIFWAAYNAMYPLSRQLSIFEGSLTRSMLNWIVKGLRFLVALIGVAAVLNIWGIQIGPILAGLGILGVAVALGAQDLFKNLIAGAMILVEKRFDIGEWILVEGVVEGDVEKIGFRSTLVRRFDKAPVYVPNAKLSDDAVTNFSRMTYRRIHWVIGLEYRITQTQLDNICRDVEDHINASPDFVAQDKATLFVGLDKFNDSSVDILLVCFTDQIKFLDYARVKARLGIKVKEIVEAHGSSFAFPSRSVYVENTEVKDKTIVAAAGA